MLPRVLVFLLCIWSMTLAWGQPTKTGSPKSCHLVSRILGRDFLSETIRLGDLDADGSPDVLFVQNLYGPRSITCLTATSLKGEVLWQFGTPSPANGRAYCDLPVQVYDWDRDGRNEVLYVRQAVYLDSPSPNASSVRERANRYEGSATMVVLEGATGTEKMRFDLPAPADDSFLFADLTGQGRREDLVVKDRYWNMWGIGHDAKVLWQYTGSVGHYPAIADVDGDGRDEVFVGFALIDHDGRVIFEKDAHGASSRCGFRGQGRRREMADALWQRRYPLSRFGWSGDLAAPARGSAARGGGSVPD